MKSINTRKGGTKNSPGPLGLGPLYRISPGPIGLLYATVNYSWGHLWLPLWYPCSSCEYSGPFNREWHGHGTNHLGKDYPAVVGDSVRAVADGQVHLFNDSMPGFGGTKPSRKGPAIVVRHMKRDGTIFFALYGHVSSNFSQGDFVRGNQVIGTVEDYLHGPEPKPDHWPHLHFGIWDAENDFPTRRLGYGTDRSFVDPVPFLENTQYRVMIIQRFLHLISRAFGESRK